MDWDAGIWRYRSNDNIVEMIEDDYVALNLGENDPFILVFLREVEEGNNSSDIDIDNFLWESLLPFRSPQSMGNM